MCADWASDEDIHHVLAALTSPNRLAIEVAMAAGLRTSDVLAITRNQMAKGRWTVTEQKTGNRRRVHVPSICSGAARSNQGVYSFGRANWTNITPAATKPFTRTSQEPPKPFRLQSHTSTHTARKEAVQRNLGNSSPEITAVYVLSCELTARRLSAKAQRN